jgi:hypothetical protein
VIAIKEGPGNGGQLYWHAGELDLSLAASLE